MENFIRTKSINAISNLLVSSSSPNIFVTQASNIQSAELNSSPTNSFKGTSVLVFISPPNDLLKYRIKSIRIKAKFKNPTYLSTIYITGLMSQYISGSYLALGSSTASSYSQDENGYYVAEITDSQDGLSYGFLLGGYDVVDLTSLVIEIDYYSPYIIQYDGRVPANGSTADARKQIIFAWNLSTKTSNNNPPNSLITSNVKNFIFCWIGDDGVSKTITASNSPTFQAAENIFSGNEKIKWRIEGYMDNDVPIIPYDPTIYDIRDGWIVLNLISKDPLSSAYPIYPSGVVIDGSTKFEFVWNYSNELGSIQTRADIQIGSSDDNLSDFASVFGSQQSYEVEAETLPAGDLYWRVRVYNADGDAGEWSSIAHAIIIGAPFPPSISLDRISPRPIIRWQTDIQVAYQLEISDVISEYHYGATAYFEAKKIIPDGTYFVRVRVQNQYSLWSPWAEASLTVFNAPGGTISLSATTTKTGEVKLSWSATGTFTAYQILRNGSVIGETTERTYIDRLAIGACSYQIRGIVDAAGNYSLSNVQALTVTVPTVQIAPVSGGDWLALPYTTTDIREVSVSTSKSVTYQQFLGAPLPVGVIGEALSKSVQLSCAFPYRLQADAAKLEALIGQLVCVKDPRGRRYLGILGSMSHVSSRYYLSYNLTITPVDCEEVDL